MPVIIGLLKMITPVRCAALLLAVIPLASYAADQDSEWIRPQKPGDPPIWGRHDGIVFGLPSIPNVWGVPRGLIRVGLWPAGEEKPQLLNYIAVEPVTVLPTNPHKKGLSELEPSQLDTGKQGKRMWIDTSADANAWQGELITVHKNGHAVQRLSVPISVERFIANGAYVRLIASVDSDQPNEVRFQVFAQDDSPPIKELCLSATMGNWERLRLIWLKDRVLDSRKLAPDYHDKSFTADSDRYPVSEMLHTAAGDPIVYAASNEADPAAAAKLAAWPYKLPRLTQYWTVPADEALADLRLRVNERDVYWASQNHVYGGIAFENFEVRQQYKPGQTFIYGISRSEPWDLYDGPQKLPPYPLDPFPGD